VPPTSDQTSDLTSDLTNPESRRLLIVDDDQLSREVLALLAAEAGFEVESYESGEAALEALAAVSALIPDVVLADMQMPGISGDSFGRLLRAACGPATVLLAMSGTGVTAERTGAFDRFLLKPFSMDDVCAVLDKQGQSTATEPDSTVLLNESILASFSQSMSPGQVRQLYSMCLGDAETRVETMRKAAEAGDAEAYRRAAHAIKGSCGMVGALELARLAAAMEENGPETVDSSVTLEEFLSASLRLRRILDALLT
jgi:CheY-like chemotaxis protein